MNRNGRQGWMSVALDCARTVQGTTAPNPSVGAVLVKDGMEIGCGATRPAGGLHAERVAIEDCLSRGNDPTGALLFATLEPCCHHGKQPPCIDAILDAGIAKVVIGVLDPNPVVCGRSVELLRDAGVEVHIGVDSIACARSILGFARTVTRGLPEVTLKTATSVDGAIATAAGQSQWITSEAARQASQELRASHDAILVGIGTVLADDPRLTCRLEGKTSPVPVVLDTQLRLPVGARLDRPGTLVFTGVEGERQATVIPTALGADGRVDIEAVLRQLASRGLHRVLVEGGGEVARTLLDAGLVDTLEQFVAGKLIPGGRGFVGGPAAEGLDGYALSLHRHRRIGPDLHLTWWLDHREPPAWVEDDPCSPES